MQNYPGDTIQVGGYVPRVANLEKNFAVNWRQWESVKGALYDSAIYPTTGILQLNFFQVPVGSGTSAFTGAKTLTDTNMQLNGQLPANQMFLIQSCEVHYQPALPTVAAAMPSFFGAEAAQTSVNDAYIFRRSGNLILTIGSKAYLTEGPMMRFPPRQRLAIDTALADATTAAASLQSRTGFADAAGVPYIFTPNNLLLISGQNFTVQLNWPEGVQAVTAAARVMVFLNGLLYRKAQ